MQEGQAACNLSQSVIPEGLREEEKVRGKLSALLLLLLSKFSRKSPFLVSFHLLAF